MKSSSEKISNLSKKSFRILAASILIVAFVLRLTYLLSYNPPLYEHRGDSPVYDIPAWNLVLGNGYTDTPGQVFTDREPGYAVLLLAPVYSLTGHNYFAVTLVQILMDTSLVLGIILLCRRHFRPSVGLLAGLLYALYVPAIFAAGEIMTETFFSFVLFWIVFACLEVNAKKNRTWLFWLGIGCLIGLLSLIRWGALFYPFFIAMFAGISQRSWKQFFTTGLMLLIGVVIITTPWLYIAQDKQDKFVFGRTGGGQIMWSGSYIPWDGDWYGDAEPAKSIKAGLSDIEAEEKFTHLAVENIKENPIGVGWIWLKKPYKILYSPEAYAYIYTVENSVSENKNYFLTLFLFITIRFHQFILGVAIVGVLWKWRLLPKSVVMLFVGTVIYFLAIYLPLNSTSRYNLPLIPFATIITAFFSIHCIHYFPKLKKFIPRYYEKR